MKYPNSFLIEVSIKELCLVLFQLDENCESVDGKQFILGFCTIKS